MTQERTDTADIRASRVFAEPLAASDAASASSHAVRAMLAPPG